MILRAQTAAAAWHGNETAGQVAARCGFASGQAVRNYWVDLKRAGKLPDSHRPHFPPLVLSRDPILVDATDAGGADLDDDGCGLRIPDDDPLLAALRRVHGNDPLRAFDDVKEIDQDGKRIVLPSPARLRAMAAIRDGLAQALIKNFGGRGYGGKRCEGH